MQETQQGNLSENGQKKHITAVFYTRSPQTVENVWDSKLIFSSVNGRRGIYWKHIDQVQASEYIFAALHVAACILYYFKDIPITS